MEVRFSPLSPDDGKDVIDIFNYYIEHSFAAYREDPVPYEAYDAMRQRTCGYPTLGAWDEKGRMLGFATLRPLNPNPSFGHTAEITYFLHPDATGQGLGEQMLHRLIQEARAQGITIIMASISGFNEGSLRFHRRHGFEECGRFKKIGKKKGEFFDVVWMQKNI